MTKTKDITIEQGTSYQLILIWKTNGVVKDLTGWTGTGIIRDGATQVADFDITIDGPNGKVLIALTPTESSSIDLSSIAYGAFKNFRYDIFLTDGTIKVKPLKGVIKLYR